MGFTTRKRTGGGQEIEELDDSVAADAVRQEVVVRPPAGAAAGLVVDTELPAAGALAGGMANPTTPLAGACVMGFDGTSWYRARLASTADALGAAVDAMIAAACGFHYNGTNFDRSRGNVASTLLASAARTATVSSADQTFYNQRGVRVSIDVSLAAAGVSIVPAIQVKDPVSGVYTAVLTGAAIVAAGHVEMVVYPGITAAASLAAAMAMARTWRVTMTHATADSATYSVAAVELV